jgi:hypothetical protein
MTVSSTTPCVKQLSSPAGFVKKVAMGAGGLL